MQRIALITGAASGIGLATAKAFAAAGYAIVICDIDGGRAEAALPQLQERGRMALAMDVSDEASVIAGFDRAERDVGPVAVLAHFAGVLGHAKGTRPSIADLGVDQWDAIMDTNLRGTFLCVREMLRRRKARPVEHGRIITTSSMAAQSGARNGNAAYAASKGGVLALNKMAALEAASLGITVNTISPGAIDTPLLRSVMPAEMDAAYAASVPMSRIGRPEDVAAAALYLASEAASFVTGSCLDVNGGARMQ